MKLYKKIDDNGISHIMPYNKIVIVKDGMQIFNPTEDILNENGWIEHITPIFEISYEEQLKMEKENKVNDIVEFDSSDVINIFYVNGLPM